MRQKQQIKKKPVSNRLFPKLTIHIILLHAKSHKKKTCCKHKFFTAKLQVRILGQQKVSRMFRLFLRKCDKLCQYLENRARICRIIVYSYHKIAM